MIGGLLKSASRVAIVAAAGVLAGGVAAQAADLGYGGNCCADLEERVAELEATAARKGNRVVSLTVYGAVNQSILWHDDEFGYREGKATVRDNSAYMSRFGFRGEAQIRPDLTAGYVIELGLSNNDLGTSGDNITIRHNYVYLDSQQFGRVNLGQTSQVTDGLYEINLATTYVTPGGMDEAEYALHGHFTDIFVNGFDGGRKQGVYYSTPSLAGFLLSVGYSHDTGELVHEGAFADHVHDAADYWEVALRYAGEFNGVRVAAGVGYRAKEDNPQVGPAEDEETILGSASIMHTPTGLFLSGGYATTDSDASNFGIDYDDKDGYWVMTGVEKNFFGYGNTTLFAEYSEVNYDDVDDKGRYWGAGIVQNIDAAAMALYLNWRNYDVEDSGIGDVDEDANVVVGGAIIKF